MFRRSITTITLITFLTTSIGVDVGWAARAAPELPSVTSGVSGSPAFKDLKVDTFNLPEYMGRIKDSWSPPVPGSQTPAPDVVVHIQDAHCNYGAQHAINDIINYVSREYGVSMLNLEGGSQDYDLSIFTRIPDIKIREQVADSFVREGLINGAEYFAINNPEKATLWGIEDTGLYLENLSIYRDSLKNKEEIEQYVKSINYILSNLKPKIYSKELLDFDMQYGAYKAGNVEFKDYVTFLIGKAAEKAIDISAYPNLSLLSQSMDSEKAIDFRRANKERDILIDNLQKLLSQREMETVVLKTVEFKAGRLSQADFYSYLLKKAKSVKLEVKDYPELEKYINYVSTYNKIDRSKIVTDMAGLEDRIKESLYRNDTERKLSLLSKNLSLLKNIFNITLTKDDFRYYQANTDSFNMSNYVSFINSQAPLYKITATLDQNITRLDQYRDEITKFYDYSLKRDEAFMRNVKFSEGLGSRVKGQGGQIAIIVTGGFHTENLCELFKRNNISYISIVPNFKNPQGYEAPYFGLLAGEMTGLQKRIYSVIADLPTAAMQVASLLSSPQLANAVWGPRSVTAFKVMAVITEKMNNWQDIAGVELTSDGKSLKFAMKNGSTQEMGLGEILDAVNQTQIDARMEAGEFIEMAGAERAAIRAMAMQLTDDPALRLQIENLFAGKDLHVQRSTGLDQDGHVGGFGVSIRASLQGDAAKRAALHEIVAGFVEDHTKIDAIVDALMKGDPKAKAIFAQAATAKHTTAKGVTALWEMTPEQRFAVAEKRDFAQLPAPAAVGPSGRRVAAAPQAKPLPTVALPAAAQQQARSELNKRLSEMRGKIAALEEQRRNQSDELSGLSAKRELLLNGYIDLLKSLLDKGFWQVDFKPDNSIRRRDGRIVTFDYDKLFEASDVTWDEMVYFIYAAVLQTAQFTLRPQAVDAAGNFRPEWFDAYLNDYLDKMHDRGIGRLIFGKRGSDQRQKIIALVEAYRQSKEDGMSFRDFALQKLKPFAENVFDDPAKILRSLKMDENEWVNSSPRLKMITRRRREAEAAGKNKLVQALREERNELVKQRLYMLSIVGLAGIQASEARMGRRTADPAVISKLEIEPVCYDILRCGIGKAWQGGVNGVYTRNKFMEDVDNILKLYKTELAKTAATPRDRAQVFANVLLFMLKAKDKSIGSASQSAQVFNNMFEASADRVAMASSMLAFLERIAARDPAAMAQIDQMLIDKKVFSMTLGRDFTSNICRGTSGGTIGKVFKVNPATGATEPAKPNYRITLGMQYRGQQVRYLGEETITDSRGNQLQVIRIEFPSKEQVLMTEDAFDSMMSSITGTQRRAEFFSRAMGDIKGFVLEPRFYEYNGKVIGSTRVEFESDQEVKKQLLKNAVDISEIEARIVKTDSQLSEARAQLAAIGSGIALPEAAEEQIEIAKPQVQAATYRATDPNNKGYGVSLRRYENGNIELGLRKTDSSGRFALGDDIPVTAKYIADPARQNDIALKLAARQSDVSADTILSLLRNVMVQANLLAVPQPVAAPSLDPRPSPAQSAVAQQVPAVVTPKIAPRAAAAAVPAQVAVSAPYIVATDRGDGWYMVGLRTRTADGEELVSGRDVPVRAADINTPMRQEYLRQEFAARLPAGTNVEGLLKAALQAKVVDLGRFEGMKAAAEREGVPVEPAGYTMKRIGDEDTGKEAQELMTRLAETSQQDVIQGLPIVIFGAASSQARIVTSAKKTLGGEVKVVRMDLGDIPSAQIRIGGTLYIILNSRGNKAFEAEAIYHEFREAFWLAKTDLMRNLILSTDFTAERIAHIIASAEQMALFAPKGITPFQKSEIERMAKEGPAPLEALLNENRELHRLILEVAAATIGGKNKFIGQDDRFLAYVKDIFAKNFPEDSKRLIQPGAPGIRVAAGEVTAVTPYDESMISEKLARDIRKDVKNFDGSDMAMKNISSALQQALEIALIQEEAGALYTEKEELLKKGKESALSQDEQRRLFSLQERFSKFMGKMTTANFIPVILKAIIELNEYLIAHPETLRIAQVPALISDQTNFVDQVSKMRLPGVGIPVEGPVTDLARKEIEKVSAALEKQKEARARIVALEQIKAAAARGGITEAGVSPVETPKAEETTTIAAGETMVVKGGTEAVAKETTPWVAKGGVERFLEMSSLQELDRLNKAVAEKLFEEGLKLLGPKDDGSPRTGTAEPDAITNVRGSAGSYARGDQLGKGGFAAVNAGFDSAGNAVAIKTLNTDANIGKKLAFLREAFILKSLKGDKNVVGFIDFAVAESARGEQYYIVMDRADQTLAQLLDRRGEETGKGAITDKEGERLARSLLRAIKRLHDRGIWHTDIKPANIFIPKKMENGESVDDFDNVILGDFGIALYGESIPTDSNKRAEKFGGILMTSPAYAPREVLEGNNYSTKTDVYMAGATLYRVLKGEDRFKGTSMQELFKFITEGIEQPIEIEGALSQLVTGLMENDPDKRLPLDKALALVPETRAPPSAPTLATKATRELVEGFFSRHITWMPSFMVEIFVRMAAPVLEAGTILMALFSRERIRDFIEVQHERVADPQLAERQITQRYFGFGLIWAATIGTFLLSFIGNADPAASQLIAALIYGITCAVIANIATHLGWDLLASPLLGLAPLATGKGVPGPAAPQAGLGVEIVGGIRPDLELPGFRDRGRYNAGSIEQGFLFDINERAKNVKESVTTELKEDVRDRISRGDILLIGPGFNAQEIFMLFMAFPEMSSLSVVDIHGPNLLRIKGILESVTDEELKEYNLTREKVRSKVKLYHADMRDLSCLPKDKKFDACYSYAAMEFGDSEGVDELEKRLKPDGVFIGMTEHFFTRRGHGKTPFTVRSGVGLETQIAALTDKVFKPGSIAPLLGGGLGAKQFEALVKTGDIPVIINYLGTMGFDANSVKDAADWLSESNPTRLDEFRRSLAQAKLAAAKVAAPQAAAPSEQLVSDMLKNSSASGLIERLGGIDEFLKMIKNADNIRFGQILTPETGPDKKAQRLIDGLELIRPLIEKGLINADQLNSVISQSRFDFTAACDSLSKLSQAIQFNGIQALIEMGEVARPRFLSPTVPLDRFAWLAGYGDVLAKYKAGTITQMKKFLAEIDGRTEGMDQVRLEGDRQLKVLNFLRQTIKDNSPYTDEVLLILLLIGRYYSPQYFEYGEERVNISATQYAVNDALAAHSALMDIAPTMEELAKSQSEVAVRMRSFMDILRRYGVETFTVMMNQRLTMENFDEFYPLIISDSVGMDKVLRSNTTGKVDEDLFYRMFAGMPRYTLDQDAKDRIKKDISRIALDILMSKGMNIRAYIAAADLLGTAELEKMVATTDLKTLDPRSAAAILYNLFRYKEDSVERFRADEQLMYNLLPVAGTSESDVGIMMASLVTDIRNKEPEKFFAELIKNYAGLDVNERSRYVVAFKDLMPGLLEALDALDKRLLDEASIQIIIDFLRAKNFKGINPNRFPIYISRLAADSRRLAGIAEETKRAEEMRKLVGEADKDYEIFIDKIYSGLRPDDYGLYVGWLYRLMGPKVTMTTLGEIAKELNIEMRGRPLEDVLRDIDSRIRTVGIAMPMTRSIAGFEASEVRLKLSSNNARDLRAALSYIVNREGVVNVADIKKRIAESMKAADSSDIDALERMRMPKNLIDQLRLLTDIDGVIGRADKKELGMLGIKDKRTLNALEKGDDKAKVSVRQSLEIKRDEVRENVKRIILKNTELAKEEIYALLNGVLNKLDIDLIRKFIRGKTDAQEDNLVFTRLSGSSIEMGELMSELGLGALEDKLSRSAEWRFVGEVRSEVKELVEEKEASRKDIKIVFSPKNIVDIYQGKYSGTCFGDHPYDMLDEDLVVAKILVGGELEGSILFNIQGDKLIMIGFDPSEGLKIGLSEKKLLELADRIMAEVYLFARANNMGLLITDQAGGLSNETSLEKYLEKNYAGKDKPVEVEKRVYHPVHKYPMTSAQRAKPIADTPAAKYADRTLIAPAIGKGVLRPTIWLVSKALIGLEKFLNLFGVRMNLRLEKRPDLRIFIEDYLVPPIEEGLMFAALYLSGSALLYGGLRIAFILAHYVQGRAPPTEAITMPSLISISALLPLHLIGVTPIGLAATFVIGTFVHIIANNYVTNRMLRFGPYITMEDAEVIIETIGGRLFPETTASYKEKTNTAPASLGSLAGRLGDYTDIRWIDEGGFADVYKATNANGEEVAIKVLKDDLRKRDALLFFREYETLRRASGIKGVVGVYEAGSFKDSQGELHYFIVEQLAKGGQPLREYLLDKFGARPMSMEEVADVMDITNQLLTTAAELHKRGIIHCDLTPGNVYISRDENGKRVVTLLDFGLSMVLPKNNSKLQFFADNEPMVLGTPGYRAKQIEDWGIYSSKSDMVSLGALLYYLWNGTALTPELRLAEEKKLKSGESEESSMDDLIARLIMEDNPATGEPLREQKIGIYSAEEALQLMDGVASYESNPLRLISKWTAEETRLAKEAEEAKEEAFELVSRAAAARDALEGLAPEPAGIVEAERLLVETPVTETTVTAKALPTVVVPKSAGIVEEEPLTETGVAPAEPALAGRAAVDEELLRERMRKFYEYYTLYSMALTEDMDEVDQNLNEFGKGFTQTAERSANTIKLEESGRQYEVGAKIAEGGFGVTYMGSDKQGRAVVIKEVTLEDGRVTQILILLREFMLMKLMQNNPALARNMAAARDVGFYDTVDKEGRSVRKYFMVMDYAGRPLSEVLGEVKSGQYNYIELARMLRGMLELLVQLQRTGITHKDIKANNICVPVKTDAEGREVLDFANPILIDYGAAVPAEDRAQAVRYSRFFSIGNLYSYALSDGNGIEEVNDRDAPYFIDLYSLAAFLKIELQSIAGSLTQIIEQLRTRDPVKLTELRRDMGLDRYTEYDSAALVILENFLTEILTNYEPGKRVDAATVLAKLTPEFDRLESLYAQRALPSEAEVAEEELGIAEALTPAPAAPEGPIMLLDRPAMRAAAARGALEGLSPEPVGLPEKEAGVTTGPTIIAPMPEAAREDEMQVGARAAPTVIMEEVERMPAAVAPIEAVPIIVQNVDGTTDVGRLADNRPKIADIGRAYITSEATALLGHKRDIRQIEDKDIRVIVVLDDAERLKENNAYQYNAKGMVGINNPAARLISRTNSRIEYVDNINDALKLTKERKVTDTFIFVESAVRDRERKVGKTDYDSLKEQGFLIWNLNIPPGSICKTTPLGFLLFGHGLRELIQRREDPEYDPQPLAEILLRNAGEDVNAANVGRIIETIIKPMADALKARGPAAIKEFSGKYTLNLPRMEPVDSKATEAYFNSLKQVYTSL